MTYRSGKLVRFNDWDSDKSPDGQYSGNYGMRSDKFRTTINSFSEKFQRGLESGSERFKGFRKTLRSYSFNSFVNKGLGSEKKVLDPQGPFLERWNKIFVLSCMVAISLDPLFFYVPVINDNKKCLTLDRKMETTASVLRSFTDIFYLLHIIFQFRTGFIAPPSRVFGRGILVEDTWLIAKKYLSSYFLIDILAVLPLPQVVILIIIPRLGGSEALNTKNLLKFVVFFQYFPRFIRIYPLYKEVTRTSGILTETAWAGAAFNLFLYMLASHIFGAFWYLFSIERETTCWKQACVGHTGCFLFCDDGEGNRNSALLSAACPIQTPNTTQFNFGIFLDALQSGVVESTYFPKKFFYCFWWGLQNLRLYSQQWRSWAACFIQAAWRRYSKKKLEESLRAEENRLQDALSKAGGNSPSLGATIYASRFAANALRAIRRNGTRKARVPERVPPMLLQKPAEPDFTAEEQ
ncbi:hypothetical protein Patl1_20325 [Pistacia atlantica]|uniref:Uncharacterized protein n=1 Tax=Pistacia atlantica TaxID=434234 RepID=A0ACC1BHW5_9ROSI|nr:hypothetical protein Patl1_20325 [Pistacia atlantica]